MKEVIRLLKHIAHLLHELEYYERCKKYVDPSRTDCEECK